MKSHVNATDAGHRLTEKDIAMIDRTPVTIAKNARTLAAFLDAHPDLPEPTHYEVQDDRTNGKPMKTAPYATCPSDGEPLVSTFEFHGAEFYCVVCERQYGFLSPRPAEPTPELDARHTVLRARYEVERAAREEAAS